MNKQFEARLERLSGSDAAKRLRRGRTGIEKESLRVSPDGHIAATPHSRALGSALTHPYITTDYSEALLEFITPPFAKAQDTLEFLEQIHQFVYHSIGDELLWAASMPCMVGDDGNIPIARFGSSNVGMMKHVYRRGLNYRYGGTMQIIAGVHYNYSFTDGFWRALQELEGDARPKRDYIADAYFGIIRNFQRFGWVIPYLFGSSPAVCKSFIRSPAEGLAEIDHGTLSRPYATSLRMSDIGYKNPNQSELRVVYDNLRTYVETLSHVIETPHHEYEEIGVKVDGEYRQLNANLLQIENEYYSFIRPKQIARSGEKPTVALKRRGVRYVEVRALDVNPFDPVGVNEEQLRFLEVFIIYCLLNESPSISWAEQNDINHNQQLVACCGRDPHLELRVGGQSRRLRAWIDAICADLEGISELLDSGRRSTPYRDAVLRQRELASHPDGLPSAQVLEEMRDRNESFFEFAMRVSLAQRDYFTSTRLSATKRRVFEEEAIRSIRAQEDIEKVDDISFDEYLRRYFAQSAVEKERIPG